MSGHKKATISISQEEFDRLYEAEKRLRLLEKEQSSQSKALQQQTAQWLREEYDRVQKDHQKLVESLSHLGFDIATLEEKINQRLYEKQSSFIQQIDEFKDQANQLTRSLIEHYTHQILETIEEEKTWRQQQMQAIQQDLQEIRIDRQSKHQISALSIEMAEEYLSYIREHFDHEKFTPGAVRKLEMLLRQSQDHFTLGMDEAAYLSAVQVGNQLAELRLDLEEKNQQWLVNYYFVLQQIHELIGCAEQQRTVAGIDLEGNLLPEILDVNFWSGGRLRKFTEYLGNLAISLQEEWHQFSLEELIALRDQLIPDLEEQLDQMVRNARFRALNSQLRINVADVVIQALMTQGFVKVGSSYENNDERREYFTRLRNYQGDEVILRVTPVPGDTGENEMHIRSLDAEKHTQHELMQRANEISSALKTYGLEVSPIAIVPDLEPQPLQSARLSGTQKVPSKQAPAKRWISIQNGTTRENSQNR